MVVADQRGPGGAVLAPCQRAWIVFLFAGCIPQWPKAAKGSTDSPRYSSAFSESRRDGTAAKIIHAVHERVERLESAGRVVQFRIKDYDACLQQQVSTVDATGAASACCMAACVVTLAYCCVVLS